MIDKLYTRQAAIIAASIFGLAIVLILAFSIRGATTFNLKNSDPQDEGNPNQYTHVTFNFNRPLLTGTSGVNELTISPGVEGNAIITDSSIEFKPSATFNPGVKYTVTLKNIRSQSNDKLADITISFTPKYVDYTDLPADTQKELIRDDTDKPDVYDYQAIALGGQTALTDGGLSTDQMANLHRAFYNFFTAQKKEVRNLDISNYIKSKHVIGSFDDTVTFDVFIAGVHTYNARLVYTGVYDVHLYLTDTKTGQQVFDSGVLTEPKT